MSAYMEQLEEENAQLRKIVSECADAVDRVKRETAQTELDL